MSAGAIRAGAPAAASGAGANPWLIAVLVALAAFMEVLDTTIANVALPYIAGGMGVSEDEASWVVTTYLVSNAIILTASSFLARMFGRKTFFLICLGLFTAELGAVRLCLESAMRCCCSASCRASAAAAWCRWRSRSWPIPSRRKSAARPSRCSASRWSWRRWSGRRSAAGSSDNFSWRWCFLINGPVGLVTIALIALLLRESAAAASSDAGAEARAGFDRRRLPAGRDLPRRARGRARPRPGGRLVRLDLHRHVHGHLRARLRADDPVGDEPPQSDDRHADGGDAPVRRLLPGDAGDRRHPARDHPVPAAAGAAGFRLYRDLGRPRALAGRRSSPW